MKDKGVKVVVDYTNGYYNVIGMYNGRSYQMHKIIRGQDRDSFFKASYSRKLIRFRRKEMEEDVKRIIKKDPNFKYSKKMIKKVDPLMYKALQDWDMMSGTRYALDYLKTMIQKFDKDQSYYAAREFYDESCATARKDDLARAGIDISYNVGLFNTSKTLNIFDKIRGMLIARDQEKLIKANVHSSLVLKRDYYLDDIDRFISDDIPDVEDTILEDTIVEDSRNEEELQQRQRAEEVQEIMDEIDKENARKAAQEAEEQRLAREKAEKEANDRARQDKNKKRTVHKPHAPEDPAKKSKKYENTGKKKRVRSHTGVRSGPTKKQREKAARIAKKEYNSHYNTQMRLKAEREERRKQAEEGMRKAAEAKRLEEERAAEARRLEEEKAEEARKLAEKQRLAEEMAAEQQRLADEREAERIRLEQEKAKLERQKKISKITNNKFTRRAKAEVRHWHRKLRDVKDSIKNMKFKPHIGKKLKITAPKFKLSEMVAKAGRRVKAEVRHYKRKIRSAKESIKNMKFKPHLGPKGKKILITGVAGVLAIGMMFGTAKMWGTNRGTIPTVTDTTITEEYTEQDENFKPSENATTTPSGMEQGETEHEETTPPEIEKDETNKEETKPSETEKEEPTKVETIESGAHQPGTVEQGAVDQGGAAPGNIEQGTIEQEETLGTAESGIGQEGTKPSGTEQEETATPSGTEQEETTPPSGVEQGDTEKTEEEKLEEFKEMALQKYQEALVIGETPQIGDILMDQTYSEKPNGTGHTGYFASHPDYAIGHINIVTKDGYEVVRADGRNLSELLAEYPDYITYNIHFVDSKTGGWLGFVTQEQYEQVVQNKINQIIKTKTIDKNVTLDEDDIMR